MSTLLNQPNRWDHVNFGTLTDLEELVRDIKEIATDNTVDYKDVLATYSASTERTMAMARVTDWDVKDEQLGGFGEILQEAITLLGRLRVDDQEPLEHLEEKVNALFRERLEGMDTGKHYPTKT